MYSPSKKISEVLSKYLEFDTEQLKVGIWSGHLSLTDVSLREEAIYPLLNKHRGSKPLRFKLVSGTVGSLEMKIPWKRLVWGQGDVQVHLKNVTIVVALESRQETEARTTTGRSTTDLFPDMFNEQSADEMLETTASARHYARELKQNRLREAERRNLKGLPLGAWVRSVHKRDKAALQKLKIQEQEPDNRVGKFDTWLQGATKDFFWRFHAGLAMTMEHVKIVLTQDGVEVGVIFPSTQMAVAKNAPTKKSSQVEAAEVDQTKDVVVQKEEFDDGEHVAKTIKFTGVGIYIRGPIRLGDPSTKEFVLRPVDLSFTYSLFYPYPPDKRKHRSSHETVTTIGETGDASASMTSSKRRRGKREKVPPLLAPMSIEEERADEGEETDTPMPLLQQSLPKRSATNDTFTSAPFGVGTSAASPLVDQSSARDINSSHFNNLKRQPSVPIRQSDPSATQERFDVHKSRHCKSHLSSILPLVRPDDLGSIYAAATKFNDLAPRLTTTVKIGAVEVVCSNRHYTLLMTVLASGARMRNGRPSKTIASMLDGERFIRTQYTLKTHQTTPVPIDILDRASIGVGESSASGEEIRIQLGGSERSKVTRLWWQYALRAVMWELRQRKKLRNEFQKIYLSFDWDKQHYKRREYVQLYIAMYLDKSQSRITNLFGSSESDLLAIEDKLCIEQILLYRNLARALYVRGCIAMPDSILDVRGHGISADKQYISSSKPAKLVGTTNRSIPTVKSVTSDAVPSFMADMEQRSHIARLRRDDPHKLDLSSYTAYRPPSGVATATPSVIDDGTCIHSIDTRATKGVKRKAFDIKKISPTVQQERAVMRISFSLDLEKMELMVEEDDHLFVQQSELSLTESKVGGNSYNGSEASLTDVSVLTDDQRFFKDNVDGQDPTDAESRDDGPILASTDFLLFRKPENVLLRVTVMPLNASVLMLGGGSKNINLTIGHVEGIGVEECRILSVGSNLKTKRIAEPSLAAGSRFSLNYERTIDNFCKSPDTALSLSLVLERSENILQLDAATVLTQLHSETVNKLAAFTTCSSAFFPTKVIPRDSREKARLHVMNLNSTSVVNKLNCSLRVHGFEMILPAVDEDAASADLSSDAVGSAASSRTGLGIGAVIRAGMIELYGGSAVQALRVQPDRNQGDSLGPLDSQHAEMQETRGLRMLNIDERTANRSSLLAHHWVS
jgi:hypothetical protein